MSKAHADRMLQEYWDGADLVMEVVSEGAENRRRDLKLKCEEYARAKIPEYWIVDPEEERITVLRLARKHYVVHGEFGKDMTATSPLLPEFSVPVSVALAQALRPGAAKPTGNTGRKRSRNAN